MIDTTASPEHLREDVDELDERLARIAAQRTVIRTVGDDLHGAWTPATLLSTLLTLERDLTLAARAAQRVRDRADDEAAT